MYSGDSGSDVGGGYGRGRGGRYRGRGGYRGRGRGGGMGFQRRRVFRLQTFKEIEDMNELTFRLASSLTEFEEYLANNSMSNQDVYDLLLVLLKVCKNELQAGSVTKVLRLICKYQFMDSGLLSLIRCVQNDQRLLSKVAESIVSLTQHICTKLPLNASKALLLINAILGNQTVVSKLRREDPEVISSLQTAKEECERCFTDAQRRRRSGGRRGPNDDDEIPPEDFTELPIVPGVRDMDWNEDHFLRANKSQGAFRDTDHYLDVQFRLLREDYIQPLRNGIKEYQRLKQTGGDASKIQDVRLYFNVQIVELVCDRSLEHLLQFDVSLFKGIRWQASRRLIFGSLVCLSRDDFKTIYFAVVTDRNVHDLENGIIQVKFENCLNEILDLSGDEVFTMAECVTFFEAHRHVLSGMQELSRAGRDFPMSRYIVQCQTYVDAPDYMQQRNRGRMDLKCLLRDENYFQPHEVRVLRPESWPRLSQTGFNQSQYDAVKTALTKELAIIQGPPGTGKTYVGLKIARALLENRVVWNEQGEERPMLVVCYTNHALDQFLEGILDFLPSGIVRVGGRSKSDKLQSLNLKEIRRSKQKKRQVSLSTRNSIKDCLRERDGIRDRLEENAASLSATRMGILGEQLLKSSMPPQHYASLVDGRPYYGRTRNRRSLMVEWLTSGQMTAEDDATVCKKLVAEITAKILKDSGTRDESTADQQTVLQLPYPERAKLYRFWAEKVSTTLKGSTPEFDRRLKVMAKTEILSDHILSYVMDKQLFSVISSHENLQSGGGNLKYCVRSWLGIPEVSQDRQELQKVLQQHNSVEVSQEEILRNIEEEAILLEQQRHIDDDDQEEYGYRRQSRYTVYDAVSKLGVDTSLTLLSAGTGTDGFTTSSTQKKKDAKHILRLLKTAEPMTATEASRYPRLWSDTLSAKERVRLYLYWLRSYQAQLKEKIKEDADLYVQESDRLAELRLGEDCDILREATVIGMTTTGASRLRKVLDNIGCPIVILEEAAEVLEAHVITTLNQSCEHLILIGDHQQLRPSPTVYELSRNYQLDLSLFERLVNNRLHHCTLEVQHRMQPEVARLVRHVYPHLKDHATTQNRPKIRGVKENVFLLHHEVRETQQKDGSSKMNEHEAEFCTRLCKYLMQQEYPPDKITILAAYAGQVSVFRKIMATYGTFFEEIRVTTIDNYQGEENDIIILSLVRSNEQGNVGFLSTDNRVCVALSRARNGLYAFGNFDLLAEKSDLWKKIKSTAQENGQLGRQLILRCQNHPHVETAVSSGYDFHKVSEGGCRLRCSFTYPDCNHTCGRECHIRDSEHTTLKCRKPCEKIACKLGHRCTRKCSERCQPCLTKVEKILPKCGHTATIECSVESSRVQCGQPCGRTLSCGHKCKLMCWECTYRGYCDYVCSEEVEIRRSCGHTTKTKCGASLGASPCKKLCGARLDCGHLCQAKCGQCFEGRVHADCREKCGKPLPGCEHTCPLPCGTKCLPCKQACSRRCQHVSKCNKLCGVECTPCLEPCPWSCEHQACEGTCKDPCAPCHELCLKILPCRHTCFGKCGEECTCMKCEAGYDHDNDKYGRLFPGGHTKMSTSIMNLVKLPRCGHFVPAGDVSSYIDNSHQKLKNGQVFPCPICKQIIMEWDLPRFRLVFREIHFKQRKEKQALVSSTTVDALQNLKIDLSLRQLTHNAEAEKSFAYSASVADMKKDLNVNRAFAVINQTKLTRVTEMIQCLLQKRGQPDLKEDVCRLQKELLKPVSSMSDQRCRELTEETKRLAYTAVFRYIESLIPATATTTLKDLKEDINQFFEKAKKSRLKFSVAEAKEFIQRCKGRISNWDELVSKHIDLQILDARADQTLYDITKKHAKSPSSLSTTNVVSQHDTARSVSATQSAPGRNVALASRYAASSAAAAGRPDSAGLRSSAATLRYAESTPTSGTPGFTAAASAKTVASTATFRAASLRKQ